jgi:predicted nucleic acid-binding protein
MSSVVDASVAFKWLVQEAESDKAVRLRDDYRKGLVHLIAPDVFPVEIVHSLTRAERQARIAPSVGAILLGELMTVLPILHASLPLLPRAYEISSREKIGVYDCLYVALAEQEQCELVTADYRLIRSLQASFPFITPLLTLP